MAGITCDRGMPDLFSMGWGGIHAAGFLALRLFTGPGTLTPSDTLPSYTPPSGGGYADHTFANTDSFGAGSIAGGVQVYTGPNVAFSIPTSGPNILGGVFYNASTGVELAAVLLGSPVDPAAQGGTLVVTPSLEVGPAP